MIDIGFDFHKSLPEDTSSQENSIYCQRDRTWVCLSYSLRGRSSPPCFGGVYTFALLSFCKSLLAPCFPWILKFLGGWKSRTPAWVEVPLPTPRDLLRPLFSNTKNIFVCLYIQVNTHFFWEIAKNGTPRTKVIHIFNL